ncbi:hypothetical protein DSO57_1029916 [Entomophthora muscae]|uniref:Uncharacterized protein n=1 Tax=Entomophthora muscae TaxID=34485 RepID=A0ACC2RS74_9FUNG|nr:hypothetical protein DSO57_1029916 [Entomophthora muscae]
MNYIIFTAVLTAYLGIGSHQPINAQFGPEPQGPKGISYNEPAHLNSMILNPWTPLAASCPTPNMATYVIPAGTLLYLAVSLRQCNILAKAFCQAQASLETWLQHPSCPLFVVRHQYRSLREVWKGPHKQPLCGDGAAGAQAIMVKLLGILLGVFELIDSTILKGPSIATELPDLPANVYYNTQGALNELPLDVSNDMD